jgi:hypothetical protein
VLLAGCYVASCWASIFDRTQWGPDSRLYLAWTYRYLGHSELDSAHRTKDFLQGTDGIGACARLCFPPGYEAGYFHGANGAVVGARPLYPLLSAPFVALAGPWGMLVVPVLAFAFAIVGMALLGHRLWGGNWGLIAGLAVLAPWVVSRWAVMGQTEGLAIGLTVASVLFLPLGSAWARSSAGAPAGDAPPGDAPAGRRDVFWYGLLLLLNLFVRQFAIALVGGVVLVWLVAAVRDRRLRNVWLPYATVSVAIGAGILAIQSVATKAWFGGGGLNLAGRYQALTQSYFHTSGLASVPTIIRYVLRIDYSYVRFDLVLTATVALAVVAVVRRFHSDLVALAFGMFAVTLALNVVVIWPSYYRYFAPAHPLILLAALGLLASLARGTRTVPVSGWLLCGLGFAFALVVVWRREDPADGAVAALPLALAWMLVTAVAGTWFGAVAGLLTGVGMALSGNLLEAALTAWPDAILLAAAATAIALVPVAGRGAPPRRWPAAIGGSPTLRLTGYAALVAIAVVVRPVGLALVAGPVGGWLVTVRRPGERRHWAGYAGAGLTVGGAALVARWIAFGSPFGALRPGQFGAQMVADLDSIVPDRALYLTCLLAAVAAVTVLIRKRQAIAGYTVGVVLVAAVVHLGHPNRAGFADFLVAYPTLPLVIAALLAPLGAANRSHLPEPRTHQPPALAEPAAAGPDRAEPGRAEPDRAEPADVPDPTPA